jgi:hypothetical protein
MFCLRNISVDTLHKGDTEDDDDNNNNNNNNNLNTLGTDMRVLWVAYATHNTLISVPTLPR